MSLPDAADIVCGAIETGRLEEGREQLDAWQASQPANINTLSKLRYYRPMLGQHDEAIAAAKAMIALRPTGAWERMSDYLRLGELYLAVGDLDNAWRAIQVVLKWPELEDWYPAGLGRSTVQLALDISTACNTENHLCLAAFDTAINMLDDGCSTSLVILEKARDCSERFGREDLFLHFRNAASEEQKSIDRQLQGL